MKNIQIKTSVLILFFLSGMCALIYEVVWQRELVLIFGSTTFATATILAALMAGMALGSFYFGRLVDRYNQPLKIYALLEVGLGIFAILFPVLLWIVEKIYVSLHFYLQTSPNGLNLLKFLLCLGVLFIPGFLMGGTLPVISKFFIEKYHDLAWDAGTLYGTNTLGGALGCLLAGFILMLACGVRASAYAAALVNFLIAAAAWGLYRYGSPESSDKVSPNASDSPQVYPSYIYPLILSVFAISGFTALGYQVLWTRTLVFFLTSEIHSFTIMLTSFLFGLGLGSLLFSQFIDKQKNLLLILGLVEILVGLSAVLTLWEFGKIANILQFIESLLSSDWSTYVWGRFIISFFIMLVPAMLLGTVFPILSKIYTHNFQKVGGSIGIIYAVNAFGSIAGPFVAAFFLIPRMGITNSIILLAGLNLTAGLVVLFADRDSTYEIKWGVFAGTMVLVIAARVMLPLDQPLGLQKDIFKSMTTEGYKLLFYKEGISGTVTVRRTPKDPFEPHKTGRIIAINGINVAAGTPMTRITQKLQGHLPLLLFRASTGREARNVFVVGLGSGEACYANTRHEIKRLDCVELVSAEVEANHFFHDINHKVLEDPKFNLIIGDARNHLLATREIYDVIENDATHPAISINVFTRDYFQLCKQRLSENGIFSTWVPLTGLSETNLKILMRTVNDVFPHVTLWFSPINNNIHALLLGTRHKLKIDPQIFKTALLEKKVNASLAEINLNNVDALLSSLITDETQIAKVCADVPVNTDEHLHLAFGIPRQIQKGAATVQDNLLLLNSMSIPIARYLTGVQGKDLRRARTQTILATAAFYGNDTMEEIDALQQVIEISNGSDIYQQNAFKGLKAAYIKKGFENRCIGRLDASIQDFEKALDIDPLDVKACFYTAMHYFEKKEVKKAEKLLEKARAQCPDCASVLNGLSAVMILTDRHDLAEKNLKEALRLDPEYIPAYMSLSKFYIVREKYFEAMKMLRKALSFSPDLIEGHYLLSFIYAKSRRYRAAEIELKLILKKEPRNLQALSAIENLKRIQYLDPGTL